MMAASPPPRCHNGSCSRRVLLAVLLTLSCLANLMSYHGWLLTRLVGLVHLGILLCLLLLPSFPTGGVEVLPLVAAICQNVYAVHATKAWRKCQTGACDTMVVMACNVSASVWILLSLATKCAMMWFQHSEPTHDDTVLENAEADPDDESNSTESVHPPVATIHQTLEEDESHVETSSHRSGLENWRVSGSTIADSDDEIVSATGSEKKAGLFDDSDDDDDDESYNPDRYRCLFQPNEQHGSASSSALSKPNHLNEENRGHSVIGSHVTNTDEHSNATAAGHVPKDTTGMEPERNEHTSGIESHAVPMEAETLDEAFVHEDGVTSHEFDRTTIHEVEMTPATRSFAAVGGSLSSQEELEEPTMASISKECEDSPMAEASAVAEASSMAKASSVAEASAIAEADKPEDKSSASNDPTLATDKAVEEKPRSSSSAVGIEPTSMSKDPEDVLCPEKKRGLEAETPQEKDVDVEKLPTGADPEEPTLKRSKPTDESGDNRDRRGLAKTTGLDSHEVFSIADSSDEEGIQDGPLWDIPVELLGGNDIDDDDDDCLTVDTDDKEKLKDVIDDKSWAKRHLESSSSLDKEAAKKRKLDLSAKAKPPIRRPWDPTKDSFAFDTSLDAAIDAALDAPWPDPAPPVVKSPPVASLFSDLAQWLPAEALTAITTEPLVAVPPSSKPAPTPLKPAPTPLKPATTPLKPATTPLKPAPTPLKPAPTPPKATVVKAARPPFKAASTPSKATIRPSMRFAKAIPSKGTESKAKQPSSKLSWKPFPLPTVATGTWATAKATASTANPQSSSGTPSPYKASSATSKATTSRAHPAFKFTSPSCGLHSQSKATPSDSKASPSPCKPTPSSFPKSPPSAAESDSHSETTPLLSKARQSNDTPSLSNSTPSSANAAPMRAPSPSTEQDNETERRFVLVGKARLPGLGGSDTTK